MLWTRLCKVNEKLNGGVATPRMNPVVCNAGTLIALAGNRSLGLLRDLIGSVLIAGGDQTRRPQVRGPRAVTLSLLDSARTAAFRQPGALSIVAPRRANRRKAGPPRSQAPHRGSTSTWLSGGQL